MRRNSRFASRGFPPWTDAQWCGAPCSLPSKHGPITRGEQHRLEGAAGVTPWVHCLHKPWHVSGAAAVSEAQALWDGHSEHRGLCCGSVCWDFLLTSLREKGRESRRRQIFFTELKINASPLLSCSLPSTPTQRQHLLGLCC